MLLESGLNKNMNPYLPLTGKNPTKQEFSQWNDKQWLSFLQFVAFHLSAKGYDVTEDKLIQIKEWMVGVYI